MAQRQFRDDDTSVWADRFGNKSDGNLTISSNITDSTANTNCSGISGNITLTVGSNSGFAANNLLLIHQSQGTGAGNWELNKISLIEGTTFTLAYSLCNTYGTGAQVYLLKQYSNVTVNNGTTLTCQAWNGSTGGIIALLADDIKIYGYINANGSQGTLYSAPGGSGGTGGGYRGGNGSKNNSGSTTGYCGEGTAGVRYQTTSSNGNGGGGGHGDYSGGRGSGGAGGHVNNGTSGGTGTPAGSGGGTAGSVDLKTMVFGGGGGGGGNADGNTGMVVAGGGSGGGIIFLIGRSITINGSLTTNGGAGLTGQDNANAGSPGAGGSILIKGREVSLSSNITSLAGSSATATGTASAGRIHVDYLKSLSGTTNPSADTAIQKCLADPFNAAALYMLDW